LKSTETLWGRIIIRPHIDFTSTSIS